MENRNLYKLRIIWSIRYRSIIATGLLLVMFMVSVVSPGTTTVLADAGDYSIDWAAAAPFSYNHFTGGGAFDDGTIGINADVVESLQGGDFACGELVTTMDLLPTFAGLAGAKVPDDRTIDGKDILPLLTGAPGARSPHEAFYYYNYLRLNAVRSGKWKLVLPHGMVGPDD